MMRSDVEGVAEHQRQSDGTDQDAARERGRQSDDLKKGVSSPILERQIPRRTGPKCQTQHRPSGHMDGVDDH